MRNERAAATRRYMDEMSVIFAEAFEPEPEPELTPERAAVLAQRAEEDRKYAAFMAANAPARMRQAS